MLSTNRQHQQHSITKFILKMKDQGVSGYKVSEAPFDLVLVPDNHQSPFFGKLVCSLKNKFYLSNVAENIKAMNKISNKNKTSCILIIKFHGDRPKKSSWTIIQVSKDMPTSVDRNFRNEFEFIK